MNFDSSSPVVHPPLGQHQISGYSTLAGASPDSVLAFAGKENRPPARGNHAIRKRVRVPTQALMPSPGRSPIWPKGMVVHFESASSKDTGVFFSDIRSGHVSTLRGADQHVFVPAAQGYAEFRILWPGYVHMCRSFSVPTAIHGRPTTRWELAKMIVDFYCKFLDEGRRAQCSPGNEGWDVRRVSPDDLMLVNISNCDGHDAVFQAVVEIVARR